MNKFAHLRTPIERVKEQLPPNISIVDNTYCGIKSTAIFVDSDYGEFKAIPYKVIKGKQFHPLRSKEIKTKRQTKSSDEFLHSLRDGVVLDETTYTNAKTKCKLLDPEYGEFWITPVSYLAGHNHPQRGNLNRKNQILSKSEEKFKSRLPSNIKLVPGTWNGYKSIATFIIDDKEITMLASSMLNKINGGAKSKGIGLRKFDVKAQLGRPPHVTGQLREIKDYIKYPISEAIKPKEGLVQILENRYWTVIDDCLLFYRGIIPQCNSNRDIAERIGNITGSSTKFIDRVFIPQREYFSSKYQEVVVEPYFGK